MVEVDSSWLDELPEGLASHTGILRRILAHAEADPRIRALQVQGSIGRGTADSHSDLDLAMLVADSAWPAIAEELRTVVEMLDDLVDDHYEFLASAEGGEIFVASAQYRCGVQLDLLVLPAHSFAGSGPDGRTLLDRDQTLLRTDHPMRLVDPASITKWAFLCWGALADVVTCLQRGLPVAGAERLEIAREATLRCWAAAHGTEYAGYANVVAARLGVGCPWPAGWERTYPSLLPASVLHAALDLAAIQASAEALLEERLGIPPRPLGKFVQAQLELLRATPELPDSQLGPNTPPDTTQPGSHPS